VAASGYMARVGKANEKEPIMNAVAAKTGQPNRTELDRIVEPLAEYICATERPNAALRSAVSALLRSIEETNQVATRHFQLIAQGGLA
jgi:hypothetical protein